MFPAVRPLPLPSSRPPPPPPRHTHPGGTPTPHVCKLDITRHLLCNKWRHKWRGWKANERVGLGRRMKRSLNDSVWKEAPLQDSCPQSIAAHRPTEQSLSPSLFPPPPPSSFSRPFFFRCQCTCVLRAVAVPLQSPL